MAEKYCEICFEKKFGENIPDFSKSSGTKARYNGGHSSFPPSKGHLHLTKDYLIFVARRFEIRIPIASITVTQLDNHSFVVPYLDRDTIQNPGFEINKIFHSNDDEWIEQINKLLASNPSKQKPQETFLDKSGISGIEQLPINDDLKLQKIYEDLKSGKISIAEYARKIGAVKDATPTHNYPNNSSLTEPQNKNQMDSKSQEKQTPRPESKNPEHLQPSTTKDDESIRILKMRLAKGEITKEEFEETKELLKD
ncbi:MAG: SHOCT domain-containing protein [Candidatus Nitrosotenuis sp.]